MVQISFIINLHFSASVLTSGSRSVLLPVSSGSFSPDCFSCFHSKPNIPTRSGSRLAECFLLLLSESLFLCTPSVQSPVQPEAVSGKSTIPSGFGRLPLLFPQTGGLHWRQALCFHMPQMYTSSVRAQKMSATAEEKSPSEQAARPELPLP